MLTQTLQGPARCVLHEAEFELSSDSEEKEEDDAVEWLDVALRARLPGVPGFCEGKVIEHQEQETYLVEWSYPNPLSGEPVTFRQSAGVREMRKWKKPPA